MCLHCRNRLLETVLTISVIENRDQNDDAVKSCSQESKCPEYTQLTKYNTGQKVERKNYSQPDGHAKYLNATCSLLLSANQKEEILVQFQCTWPKEYHGDEDSLTIHGIKVRQNTPCVKEADGYSSGLKFEVFPDELIKKSFTGERHCDLMPDKSEPRSCSFSIYLNPLVYVVRGGENVTMYCHQNNYSIRWVAVGSNRKEISETSLSETTNHANHANGILKYFPNTKTENGDVVVMCYHEQGEEKFVIGIGVIVHEHAVLKTTSASQSSRIRKTNTNTNTHTNTLDGVTNISIISTVTSPTDNPVEGSSTGKHPEQRPGETHSTSKTIGDSNPRPITTVLISSLVIIVSVLALTLSIITCVLVVAFIFYSKNLSSRQNQDGHTHREIAISDKGKEIQMNTVSTRSLPVIPSDQSALVVEEGVPEEINSRGVPRSQKAFLDSAKGRCKSDLAANGPGQELEKQTGSRDNRVGNEGQSIQCHQADCRVSVSSDIYYALDDIGDGYEEYHEHDDREGPTKELHNQSSLPIVAPGNERPNGTTAMTTHACCSSQSGYEVPEPKRCLDDLYAKPMKSKKSEVINDVTDSTYSKLNRPAVESCRMDEASEPLGQQNTAQTHLYMTGEDTMDVSKPVPDTSDVSLDELFGSQDYQLLEHINCTQIGVDN